MANTTDSTKVLKYFNDKNDERIKSYKDKGWVNANAQMVQKGYAEPKDTVNTQYLSKDENFVGIKKKMGGVITKTDGRTTSGVISDYSNYKAPKTFVGAAPAKKMGGSVKSKRK